MKNTKLNECDSYNKRMEVLYEFVEANNLICKGHILRCPSLSEYDNSPDVDGNHPADYDQLNYK